MRLWIAAVWLLAGVLLPACSRTDPQQHDSSTVVLYTSADDQLARIVCGAFTERTGITVQILGDTEATKTTGLVARILAEQGNPRGDVWWSSEPMGTLLLAEQGVLRPGAMAGSVPPDWPVELVGADATWIGFAQRARVIAYASDRVAEPPTTMRELIDPAWEGRIGMARPQFGTTRGHMALLYERWGGESFDAWLGGLRSNRVRLYDGNMSVVRAIAMGEIDAGLTDTDDVFAGQSNGWNIDLVYESVDADPGAMAMASLGATTIPNTVGVLLGGPNPEQGARLAAFLVSEECERLIAQSPSRNTPVHSAPGAAFSDASGVSGVFVDYRPPHNRVEDAMDACERTLEGP